MKPVPKDLVEIEVLLNGKQLNRNHVEIETDKTGKQPRQYAYLKLENCKLAESGTLEIYVREMSPAKKAWITRRASG